MSTIKIALPQTASDFQATLKAGIEHATKSPYNNQNKLNDCTAAALGLSNFNALKPQLEYLQPISASYQGQDQIVNGSVIKDEVYQEEMVAYYIVPREDEIHWISEYISDGTLKGNNKSLAIEDLQLLLSWNDEYVMKSHSTNKYLSPTQHTVEWNDICNEMLELSGHKLAMPKISQPKTNNQSLAELITTSAILILEDNAFIYASEINGDSLTLFWRDFEGHECFYVWNIKEDSFVREGNGKFTLQIEDENSLKVIFMSPMNI